MAMTKLLLVDGDITLKYMIKTELEDMIGGYKVITAGNGIEGLKAWREKQPDIIVCETELPGMSGYDMVTEIRKTDAKTLILFASTKGSPKDVLIGYESGIDNYMKKPFIPEELDVHLRALNKLRGTDHRLRDEVSARKPGRYILDMENCILKNMKYGDVVFTTREAQIFRTLWEHVNEVVKREDLLKLFWDTKGDLRCASRSLDVFIAKLRKKLIDPNLQIKTTRNVGISLLFNFR
ncbi:MAG: DNA-binding response regulator [Bacteroidetes bacterium]|jgi:DNA-binding response OmpR family regulator|nr:DNA-binding response regulator [Bacteroidota bacterium]